MTQTHQIIDELLEKIKLKDRATMRLIYKEGYPMVEKYILKNNGTKNDAQDIFQDAMYLFLKKSTLPHFKLTAKPSTFIFSIAKNLWLKELTKSKIDLTDLATYQINVDSFSERDENLLERVKRMKANLIALGEPCRTILEQFYFLKTPMKQIAEMLHYTNANNAKNQKYKCFIRLKKSFLAKTER